MAILLSPKAWIAIAFAVLLLLLAGQQVRVSSAKADLAKLKQDYAQASLKAEQEARAKETEWQDTANKIAEDKDDQLKVIAGQLDAALNSLSKRAARPAGNVSKATGTCQGATGAQLYRPDGEFLARLAAAADRVAAERDACYKAYSSLTRVSP